MAASGQHRRVLPDQIVWGRLRGGCTPFFRYEESWANSPRARALSLSMPLTADLELPTAEVAIDVLAKRADHVVVTDLWPRIAGVCGINGRRT